MRSFNPDTDKNVPDKNSHFLLFLSGFLLKFH